MKFGIVLAVKDIKVSRRFYEDLLGLTVVDDFGLHVAFECGLSLQQNFGWLTGILECEMGNRANNCELRFEQVHFDELVGKVKLRPDVNLLHDVLEQSWGQRVIRFYDPDYHLIEVGENMKSVVERFMSKGMQIEDIAEKMDVNAENVHRMLDILTE